MGAEGSTRCVRQEEFPYTIRVESTITESNGSSSMATVCGACLAMQDAGAPPAATALGALSGLQCCRQIPYGISPQPVMKIGNLCCALASAELGQRVKLCGVLFDVRGPVLSGAGLHPTLEPWNPGTSRTVAASRGLK